MTSLGRQAAAKLDRPPAPIPDKRSLKALHEAVETCRACDLWEGATQAVMGEGARHAEVMMVGEQPGDREDIEGHPFVGPAGGILDKGLEQAGIARRSCAWAPRPRRRCSDRTSASGVTGGDRPTRSWLSWSR
jgi:DNA polymerase